MLEAMSKDTFYDKCALSGYKGHVCGGRITKEHAIIYGGRRLNEYWAIIPICAKAHEVDAFQDAHTMNKELNVWVALNRATNDELRAISKAKDYIRERTRLNEKHGIWIGPVLRQAIYKAGDDVNY